MIGFYGKEGDDHKRAFGLEVLVGSGDDGYENIVSMFKSFTQGMYACVVIVNPLHKSLPHLALCAIATCNRFDANWVRQ